MSDQHTARIEVAWQPSASVGEAEQVVRLVQGVATSLRENLERWDLTGLDVTLHIDPLAAHGQDHRVLWEGPLGDLVAQLDYGDIGPVLEAVRSCVPDARAVVAVVTRPDTQEAR